MIGKITSCINLPAVFGKYADCTIILKNENTWFHGIDALMISKTGETVSCLSYHIKIRDVTKSVAYLPAALKNIYYSNAYSEYDKGIGFNTYLRVLFIHSFIYRYRYQ
ncbi:hypothetical protein SAMN05216436_11461 [bacterium A37T11]|nr:hypothetical protein SAMN05216436_11461 [bacterium A37T11]